MPVIQRCILPVWLLEAVPSVGAHIPGHPLSVGESVREGGECRRGRETAERRLQRENIYNSINGSYHTVLFQIESLECICVYFVAIYDV